MVTLEVRNINKYYGEVMLNALYYLPSQFIGYYLWNKNSNGDNGDVKGKKLTVKQSIILVSLISIGVFGYKVVLDFLGGTQTLLDSASTVTSIVANALMMMRYREQWLLWIIIDAITVVMWFLAGDFIMVTMWAVYLINAFYGYYNWTKIAQDTHFSYQKAICETMAERQRKQLVQEKAQKTKKAKGTEKEITNLLTFKKRQAYA